MVQHIDIKYDMKHFIIIDPMGLTPLGVMLFGTNNIGVRFNKSNPQRGARAPCIFSSISFEGFLENVHIIHLKLAKALLYNNI